MRIIEPCCATKHLLELRNAIGKNGQTFFEGYGDLSLAEFLPALLTRYSETRMLLAAPSLPEQAVTALRRRMRQQWARMDGKGKLNNVEHLDIITDVASSPALQQLLDDERVSDRVSLHDVKQEEYVILLPDIAILGFKNMQYSDHFIATVSTRGEYVEELWTKYLLLASAPTAQEKPEKKKGGKRRKAAVEDAVPEAPQEEAQEQVGDNMSPGTEQAEEAVADAVPTGYGLSPVEEEAIVTVDAEETLQAAGDVAAIKASEPWKPEELVADSSEV